MEAVASRKKTKINLFPIREVKMVDSSKEDINGDEPQVSPDVMIVPKIPSMVRFKNEEERQAMMMSLSSCRNQTPLNQANMGSMQSSTSLGQAPGGAILTSSGVSHPKTKLLKKVVTTST